MRKRLLSLMLMMALISTCMAFFEEDAFAVSPTVHISSAVAKPGESANLTISTSDNPGITSIDFSVQYDSAQIELVAKQNGKLLGGTLNSQTIDKVPYYCGWINSLQKTNCRDDGVLMTLTFKVKEGAVKGMQTISFTKSSVTGYDADLNAVNFAAENGYIEITNSKSDSEADGNKPSQGDGESGLIPPEDQTDSAQKPEEDNIKDDIQTLTTSQKKTIAKVKGMSIRYTSAKYKKSNKTYTIKFKKTDKNCKLDGYLIYKSTKKSSGFSKVGKTTKLTWTDKKPGKKGKTYYYRLRGYREIAGKTYYTEWSVKKRLTIR